MTKFKGSEVSVIYTGSHYYFHNSYYGVIAIAERDYEKTTYGWDKEHKTHFNLSIGNVHCVGGSWHNGAIECMVRKFINKNDQKHGKVAITYDVYEVDLNKGYLTCEFKPC